MGGGLCLCESSLPSERAIAREQGSETGGRFGVSVRRGLSGSE